MTLRKEEIIPIAALIGAIELKKSGKTWDKVLDELCLHWYTSSIQGCSTRQLRYQVEKFEKERA